MRRDKQALTGCGSERVGSPKHGTTGLDSIETFNHHSDYGSREHILDEAGEERLAGKVLVVYKEQRYGTQRKDRGHLERVRYILGYTEVIMDVMEVRVEGRTLFEVLLGGSGHLEGNDFETPLFKAGYDGSNKVTLDAIRLDHDIGALVVGHGR